MSYLGSNLDNCFAFGHLMLTCDRVHSWQLYGAAPLGDQVAHTITRCPTQSHYPDPGATQSLPYSNNAKRLARK